MDTTPRPDIAKARISRKTMNAMQRLAQQQEEEQRRRRERDLYVARSLGSWNGATATERTDAERLAVEHRRTRNAFMSGVVSQAKAVMQVWGVRVPVVAKTGPFRAYTDWRSIHVNYPETGLPVFSALHGTFVGQNRLGEVVTMREVSEDLLGIIPHECGHIRFSVPYPNLLKLVRADLRFSGQPVPSGTINPDHQKCWNLLEDQRMELAVVSDSPIIGMYLTQTVKNHIIEVSQQMFDQDELGITGAMKTYALLVGRLYLPAEVRKLARRDLIQRLVAGGFELADAEARADEIKDIVRCYIEADTAVDMWRQIDRLQALDLNHTIDFDEHIEQLLNELDDDTLRELIQGLGLGSGINDDGEEGDGNPLEMPGRGLSKPDEDEDGEGGDGEPGDGWGDDTSVTPYDPTKQEDMLRDAFDSAISANHQLNWYRQGLDETAHALSDTTGVSDVTESFDGEIMEPEVQLEAESIVSDLCASFEPFLAETAPCWVPQTTSGVLDVRAYIARQPGQHDFYRRWEGDEDPGLDLEVDLICDVSGSMMGYLQALGQAMFAAGLACDYLNVPYRGWVFGSTSALIQSTGRIWPVVPDCLGGTNPVQALEWMRDTEVKAGHRLVLFMTDGQFGHIDFADYVTENTHLIGMGFSSSQALADRYAESLVEDQNCPRAVGITSLAEIPAAIGQYIETVL